MNPLSGIEAPRYSRTVLILAAVLPAALLLLIAWLTFRMASNRAHEPKQVPAADSNLHSHLGRPAQREVAGSR